MRLPHVAPYWWILMASSTVIFLNLSPDAWDLALGGITLIVLIAGNAILVWRWAFPAINRWRQGRALRLEFPGTLGGYISPSGLNSLTLELGEQTIQVIVTFGKTAYVKEVLFEFVDDGIIVSDTIVDIHYVTKEVEELEHAINQERQYHSQELGESVGISFVSARRLEKDARLLFSLESSAYLPWRGHIRVNVLDATNRRWYGKSKVEIKES